MSVFLLFLHCSHVDVLLTPNSFCGVKCVCLQRTSCGIYITSHISDVALLLQRSCARLCIQLRLPQLLVFLSFVFMVTMGLKYEIFVVYISQGNSREQRFLVTEAELPGSVVYIHRSTGKELNSCFRRHRTQGQSQSPWLLQFSVQAQSPNLQLLSCFYCEHFQGKCCRELGFGLVFIAGLGDVLLLLLFCCYLYVCAHTWVFVCLCVYFLALRCYVLLRWGYQYLVKLLLNLLCS